MSTFGRWHDRVTRGGYSIASLLLAVIVVVFCYEVTARYFFARPTSWANPLVAYLVCPIIFLVMPELTRQRLHVSINLLHQRVTPRMARMLHIGVLVLAAAACLLAFWFTFDAVLAQYQSGITTISSFAIDKWLISIFVPYGMLSSGLYFLRQLADPDATLRDPSVGFGP